MCCRCGFYQKTAKKQQNGTRLFLRSSQQTQTHLLTYLPRIAKRTESLSAFFPIEISALNDARVLKAREMRLRDATKRVLLHTFEDKIIVYSALQVALRSKCNRFCPLPPANADNQKPVGCKESNKLCMSSIRLRWTCNVLKAAMKPCLSLCKKHSDCLTHIV